MRVVDKLFKPLAYIKITNYEKRWFDFVLPIIFASITLVIILILPKQVAILGKDSLISLVNGLMQILAGFYIASMAAVATFQKDGMDDIPSNSPPKLNGNCLTRRQFLTYLFGYLAFCSIALYFLGGFALLSAHSIGLLIPATSILIKGFLLWIYLCFVSNIMCTTVLGMHFMIDKIHRSKSRYSAKTPSEAQPSLSKIKPRKVENPQSRQD